MPWIAMLRLRSIRPKRCQAGNRCLWKIPFGLVVDLVSAVADAKLKVLFLKVNVGIGVSELDPCHEGQSTGLTLGVFAAVKVLDHVGEIGEVCRTAESQADFGGSIACRIARDAVLLIDWGGARQFRWLRA